jgi:UDP-N-acetylmuramate--alanine ligase
VVAYQPHLVSRTRLFGAAMGRALSAADDVVVLPIYLAREAADPAVTSALVADAVESTPVTLVDGLESAARVLADHARAGDLVLTLGAGSVTEVAPRVLALLGSR